MVKSKALTYALWLFGGLFGLHHIYLGRDKQAFLWFSTLGCFFMGYIRDFFRLSDYLDEANHDKEYMQTLKRRAKHLKSPGFQSTRFLGSIFIAVIYGTIVRHAVPTEMNRILYLINQLLWPLGCAIGAYLVNTESYMKCKFKWALIGAYVPCLFTNSSVFLTSLLCTLCIHWKVEWHDLGQESVIADKKSVKKRLFVLILCASLYTPIAMSYLLNNSSLTINGEETKLYDALKNFLNSKAWRDIQAFVKRLWDIYRIHGFERLKNEFVNGLDAHGISHAYEVLGLPENATEADVNSKCKTLSRQWHPDRFKDETKKQEAQEKFMDIQEACNILSTKKRDKLKKNQKFDEDKTEL